MNELKEGMDALTEDRHMTRDQLLKDYAAIIDGGINDILRLKRVRDKMLEEFHQIEQILGKALGYPWFKDDPKNFPNATEADGVCVGPNTAASLAMHAADRIKMMDIREQDKQKIIDEQKKEIKELQQQLDKEYERGYQEGVDAEYERNNFRKD